VQKLSNLAFQTELWVQPFPAAGLGSVLDT
jgi:hypothetical protein